MIRPFGPNDIILIAEAIRWTLALSAIAFAGGVIGGLLIALARTSDAKWLLLSGRQRRSDGWT